MIKVPLTWSCAKYRCALVNIDKEHYYLCRITPVSTPCVSYELNTRMERTSVSDEINRNITQDFTQSELHMVKFLTKHKHTSSPTFKFVICDEEVNDYEDSTDEQENYKENVHSYTRNEKENSFIYNKNIDNQESESYVSSQVDENDKEYNCLSELRIYCPLYIREASSVILRGPRVHARNSVASLTSILCGNYVMVGCTFAAENSLYSIHAVQTSDRAVYNGVALVNTTCRVKLNNADQRECNAKELRKGQLTTEMIGLNKEKNMLIELVKFAVATKQTRVGVIVRGPRGCGVHTLVQNTLHDIIEQDKYNVLINAWTPSFNVTEHNNITFSEANYLHLPGNKAALQVLLIDEVESFFPQDNMKLSLYALRKLVEDVDRLCEQHETNAICNTRSVIVVAMTHQYGSMCATTLMQSVFLYHITLTLPDSEMRALLLTRCRGGNVETWRNLANTLVGKTSQEVLEIGNNSTWSYTAPFTPVRWDEIGGYEEVKNQLQRSLIWPLREPEVFARFNLEPPKGILLYGPPGCAKTTLVKALCSDGYFSFIYLDSATVVSAYVGESERYLRDVFARAAAQAPCIVFFDEVEVLGGRRAGNVEGNSHSSVNSSEQVRLLSTLLTEMDGFGERRGVCFVGATNAPHLIDSALLRPGRFDHLIYVPLPNIADRHVILSILLEHIHVDLDTLAEHTSEFSGADISSLCSSVLLELLANSEIIKENATGATLTKSSIEVTLSQLQNKEQITSLFLSKIAIFKRLPYNAVALEEFHREHTSYENAISSHELEFCYQF